MSPRPQTDRQERTQRAKAIGRAAYRLVRSEKLEGYIDGNDGRKLIREWQRGQLSITLGSAANKNPCDTDLSQLAVSHVGQKVLAILWNKAGDFVQTR